METPFPSSATPITWSSADASQIGRMLSGEDRTIHLSVRPRAPNGGGNAQAVSDYAEVEVGYRLP